MGMQQYPANQSIANKLCKGAHSTLTQQAILICCTISFALAHIFTYFLSRSDLLWFSAESVLIEESLVDDVALNTYLLRSNWGYDPVWDLVFLAITIGMGVLIPPVAV